MSPNKKVVLRAQSRKLADLDVQQKANFKIVNPSGSATTEEESKENVASGTKNWDNSFTICEDESQIGEADG